MEIDMKLMSLFDGSGGFPLAASLCGIEPVYAAEVEPYPIAVTKNRFPKMKHLGDVSKVKGGEIEPVDIITFGSPCQDMSIAGKKAGLKHADMGDDETTRSGLFLEAIRIIKEMREATNGVYPRYAIWETFPEPLAVTEEKILEPSLKNLLESKKRTPLCLRFHKLAGHMQIVSVETDGALHTEFLTRNIGESPSAAVESTLSQILEANVPKKYYLSAKACEGILRRAERRGKELPPMLKTALEQQSAEIVHRQC